MYVYISGYQIKEKEENIIVAGPAFQKDQIVVALEDEEGEILLVKYKTRLPE